MSLEDGQVSGLSTSEGKSRKNARFKSANTEALSLGACSSFQDPSEVVAEEVVVGWAVETVGCCKRRQAALMDDFSSKVTAGWSGSNSCQMLSNPASESEQAANVSQVQPAKMRLEVTAGGTPHSPSRLSRPPSVGATDMVPKGSGDK